MEHQNCAYCMREKNPVLLDTFGIFICELSVSDLILFKEQSHPGRCIVAYKEHVSELVNLNDEERNAFLPMWRELQKQFTKHSILTK